VTAATVKDRPKKSYAGMQNKISLMVKGLYKGGKNLQKELNKSKIPDNYPTLITSIDK